MRKFVLDDLLEPVTSKGVELDIQAILLAHSLKHPSGKVIDGWSLAIYLPMHVKGGGSPPKLSAKEKQALVKSLCNAKSSTRPQMFFGNLKCSMRRLSRILSREKANLPVGLSNRRVARNELSEGHGGEARSWILRLIVVVMRYDPLNGVSQQCKVATLRIELSMEPKEEMAHH